MLILLMSAWLFHAFDFAAVDNYVEVHFSLCSFQKIMG